MGTSILIAMGSALGGGLGAIGGWIINSFVAAPIRKFYDLRGEVICRLFEFANVPARYKKVRDDSGATSGEREVIELPAKEIERLEEAQRVMRLLGSQMRAFAENESWAAWFVGRRYDPMKASAALFGLSNAYDTYGQMRHLQRQAVEAALRIKP